jgi:signal transduction histidine kinase/ActR/RegA family two-component response regulator
MALHPRRRSTRSLIALSAALTLIPLALLAYLSVHLATNAVEHNAESRVQSNAGLAVSIFGTGMTGLATSLSTFAEQSSVRAAVAAPSSNREGLRQLLLELKNEQRSTTSVFVATRKGRLVEMVPAAPALRGTDVTTSAWYRGVRSSGKPFVSSVYRSEAPGHPNAIAVAVPVSAALGADQTTVSGFLVATLDLGATQQFVDYFSSSLGVDLAITDQNGVLLARPGYEQKKLVSLKGDPGVATALQGGTTVREQSSEQGETLSAYAPIPGVGWTVAASVPKASVFSGIDRLRSTVVAVAGGLALILLAGLAFLARSLRQRERAEAAAETARAEAERANRAKSEFLSRMSHELRTPLNAILGFGQLLSMRELDDADKERVDQILKGGQHLLALINEVLDIARIESGKLALSLEPVQISDIVRDALDLVRPLANEQGIAIRVDSVNDHEFVTADRQRLSQVMLNLLSNAIKYNRPGGSVAIVVHRTDGDTVAVEISDTGVGMSASELRRLFRPFERLGADEAQVAGTGLGLVLSKGLVEAMGGRLSVESELGTGSTFRIELAATTSPLAGAEADGALSTSAKPRAAGDHRYTILYVEDNLSNLKLVQHILSQRTDIHLIPAMQGGLGLELAREHRPDLVLLDLHLPDMDGEEVLARLQAEPAFNGTPVVVLSADATQGRVQRLLDSGASAYLSKPIDIRQFIDVIDEHAPAATQLTPLTR